jgi:hypothetical protein
VETCDAKGSYPNTAPEETPFQGIHASLWPLAYLSSSIFSLRLHILFSAIPPTTNLLYSSTSSTPPSHTPPTTERLPLRKTSNYGTPPNPVAYNQKPVRYASHDPHYSRHRLLNALQCAFCTHTVHLELPPCRSALKPKESTVPSGTM